MSTGLAPRNLVRAGSARGTDLAIPGGWTDEAVCAAADPELFFPLSGSPKAAGPAKAVCRECPVAAECLSWALEQRVPFGVWGGTSEQEREALLKAAALEKRREGRR